MGSKTKVIIFDWGRTLHDIEAGKLFDGVPELLEKLSQKYILALVSLAKLEGPEVRKEKIAASGIAKHFRMVLVNGVDKDPLYEEVLETLGVAPQEVLMVDDRVVKGIAWGNRKGAKTAWIKKGRFADELPTPETGEPTFIIQSVLEIETLAGL